MKTKIKAASRLTSFNLCHHGRFATLPDMTPSQSQQRPGRRRLLACTECRRKKLRCNHQNPCNNCQRSRTGICSYSEQNPPKTGVSQIQTTGQKAPGSTDPVISKIEGASGTLESPSDALWHDSEIGSVLLAQESPATLTKSDNTTPKTMPLKSDSQPEGQEKPTLFQVLRSLSTPVRALITRSRYMMSSHWVFAVILVSAKHGKLERIMRRADVPNSTRKSSSGSIMRLSRKGSVGSLYKSANPWETF